MIRERREKFAAEEECASKKKPHPDKKPHRRRDKSAEGTREAKKEKKRRKKRAASVAASSSASSEDQPRTELHISETVNGFHRTESRQRLKVSSPLRNTKKPLKDTSPLLITEGRGDSAKSGTSTPAVKRVTFCDHPVEITVVWLEDAVDDVSGDEEISNGEDRLQGLKVDGIRARDADDLGRQVIEC